jgi:hypothetical protein
MQHFPSEQIFGRHRLSLDDMADNPAGRSRVDMGAAIGVCTWTPRNRKRRSVTAARLRSPAADMFGSRSSTILERRGPLLPE